MLSLSLSNNFLATDIIETMGDATVRMKPMQKRQPFSTQEELWSRRRRNCYSGVKADNATAEDLAVRRSGDFGIFGNNGFNKISLFSLKSIICKYIFLQPKQHVKTQNQVIQEETMVDGRPKFTETLNVHRQKMSQLRFSH